MQRPRFWLNTSGAICLFAGVAWIATNDLRAAAPADPHADIPIWSVGESGGLAANRKLTLRIAEQAGHVLQLGFVHSGYTEEEPAGRTALLTISIVPAMTGLDSADRDALQSSGVVVSDSLTFIDNGSPELDVECEAQAACGDDIRAAWHLPMALPSTGATTPFQYRWRNADGPTLFQLLTDAAGLRLVVRARGTLQARMHIQTRFAPVAFDRWWRTIAGASTTLSWRGDAPWLILSSVSSQVVDVFADGWMPARPLTLSDDLSDFVRTLAPRIDAVSTRARHGRRTVTHEALRNLDWSSRRDVTLSTPWELESEVSPGAVLLSHAELVKDLSGGGKGLGALRGTHR